MALKLSNNASTTLAGSIGSGATSFSVAAGKGALFPTLGPDDYFPLTLIKLVGGLPVREIVYCTARAIDTFTVERAQEGTTAQSFSAGDAVELRMTAGVFSDLNSLAGTDKINTVAAATGAVSLDCTDTFVHDLTLSGNTTLSLSGLPALSTEQTTILIRIRCGATPYTLTWFGGLTWLTLNGTVPTAPAANKIAEFVITTTNNTAFLGRRGAAN